MNVGLHQRTQRRVDHPVPLDRSLARKPARKNAYLEMPAAIARSGVPDVPVAIVYDVELVGIERCLEPTSNQRYALGGHNPTNISCRRRCRGFDRSRATRSRALGPRRSTGKADHAESLEVDPDLQVVVVHDVQIESADHGEIHDPQRVSCRHIAGSSSTACPMMRSVKVFDPNSWLPRKPAANNQLTTVNFH